MRRVCQEFKTVASQCVQVVWRKLTWDVSYQWRFFYHHQWISYHSSSINLLKFLIIIWFNKTCENPIKSTSNFNSQPTFYLGDKKLSWISVGKVKNLDSNIRKEMTFFWKINFVDIRNAHIVCGALLSLFLFVQSLNCIRRLNLSVN